jgi:hypothetical protein
MQKIFLELFKLLFDFISHAGKGQADVLIPLAAILCVTWIALAALR